MLDFGFRWEEFHLQDYIHKQVYLINSFEQDAFKFMKHEMESAVALTDIFIDDGFNFPNSLKAVSYTHLQVVKTAASHAVNIGSNPVRVTTLKSVLTKGAKDNIILFVFE